MMPKSVKRSSDDIMLYLFVLTQFLTENRVTLFLELL